ncbi:RNA methyltransferase [Xylariaceae sp. FL1019]|nr:RNA methyltransferase [Xylariaceae sp. FL1019]
MRFPTSACVLGRHCLVAPKLQPFRSALPFIPSRHASSLSAIHNGLRQSQKARPQGFRQGALDTSRRAPRTARRNPRDPSWTPPEFKLRRGKKDVTDTGPERQSRRARFNDPTTSFGKRSMVYQMKHGDLRQKVAEMEARDQQQSFDRPRRGPADRMTSDDFMDGFNASSGTISKPGKAQRGRQGPAPTKFGRDRSLKGSISKGGGMFTLGASRHTPTWDSRREQDSNDLGFGSVSDRSGNVRDRAGTPRFSRSERTAPSETSFSRPRRETPVDDFEQPRRERDTRDHDTWGDRGARGYSPKTDDGTIRIHHTTAVSQFLYGRSVVEAALKDSRRQLYKLYIYGGEDRRTVSQDHALEKLARDKRIAIVKVPRDGLRMMDKMSGGRPHNGIVLEASPLPQLPLKALGSLSEDPTKPGFSVEIGHQSSEEAQINGTSDFVSYSLPKDRKPMVLLLDGILDPGNLGAIMRTAAFLGVNAVAITKSSSATLTAVALKASAGASEVMTLFSVHSAVDFLTRSKESGWAVYAAVPSTKKSRANSHLTVDRVEDYDPLSQQPLVLVVGSEGEGLSKPVRREADHEVSIPSPSGGFLNVVDSLNVSVATGILCSAFLRKQTLGMMQIEEDTPDALVEEAEKQEEAAQMW